MSETGFDQFVCGFHQDVIDFSEDSFRENTFTKLFLEPLADTGEINDFEICYFTNQKMKINAYSMVLDENRIDIFVSYYRGEFPPKKINKNDIEKHFSRSLLFFEKAINGYYKELEESSPVFDFTASIYENKENIKKIGLFLLTDFISPVEYKQEETSGNYRISYHIWDIQRLYRLQNSYRQEPIEIDFVEEFGSSIPCLPMPQQNPYYKIYAAFFSGKILAGIYDKYGSRLIERNVRSFLQAKSSVNKEIKNTIKKEPEMFLAYNNGISVVAQKVEIENIEGGYGIKRVTDFQIVNGCQTTASIYHAASKDKKDISDIFVQVKLTILTEQSNLNIIGPSISKYANTQNKINISDFSANDPFHVTLEQLSRNIWAPPNSIVPRQTRWYYERIRGQYQEDKSRQKTPKLKKLFADHNPTNQRFTKTDLAKYENTWNQLPHIVSLGSQKNYSKFIMSLDEKNEIQPDEEYFHKLIAESIMFKFADKLINQQKYGGYKANIVTYTLALISSLTQKRIDLDKIWKEQAISSALKEVIIKISRLVYQHITTPPDGRNVTEWCKKEECWKNLLKVEVEISDSLKNELLDSTEFTSDSENLIQNTEKTEDSLYTEIENNNLEEFAEPEGVSQIENKNKELDFDDFFIKQSPLKWLEFSKFARESGSFSEEQVNLIKRMGKLRERKIKPKQEQINSVQEMLKSLQSMGYEIELR
ncbi:hypothetical protein BGV40_08720 [Methanosarcina sp. Ant1]|nr:hypothetical protein BGV40_08720 [Methanosarcina sp. Ant1]